MLVLIIDDDQEYATSISDYVIVHGYRTIIRSDASDLRTIFAESRPDIVLLDQHLRESSGTDVLRELRLLSDVPCIVITGMSDPVNRIVNLELGADDEVDKSVAPRELLARIRSAARRGRTAPPPPVASAPLQPWQFCPARRELRQPDGAICPLTTAEFETLRILWEAAGQPVSRATLCAKVFKRNFAGDDRAVDTVIRKLRAKINDSSDPKVIKTVRALGYVFTGFAPPPIQAG